MNIYVVPLYRPHGGKNQNGVSEFSDSAKRAKTCNECQVRENLQRGVKDVTRPKGGETCQRESMHLAPNAGQRKSTRSQLALVFSVSNCKRFPY